MVYVKLTILLIVLGNLQRGHSDTTVASATTIYENSSNEPTVTVDGSTIQYQTNSKDSNGGTTKPVTQNVMMTNATTPYPEGYPDMPEELLLQTLFQKYNKNARPATTRMPVVNIDHSMDLIRINSFSFDTLKTDVWMTMRWHDPRLVWNPNSFFGLTLFSITPDMLWTPDVTLYNGVGEIQKSDLSRRIVVKNNGMVLWVFPAQLESTCVTRNEKGEHVCLLKFGSWTYNGLQLNLTHSGSQLGMSYYYPNPDWEITSTNSMRNVMKYACCPEPYPDISYQLSFRGAMKG